MRHWSVYYRRPVLFTKMGGLLVFKLCGIFFPDLLQNYVVGESNLWAMNIDNLPPHNHTIS